MMILHYSHLLMNALWKSNYADYTYNIQHTTNVLENVIWDIVIELLNCLMTKLNASKHRGLANVQLIGNSADLRSFNSVTVNGSCDMVL